MATTLADLMCEAVLPEKYHPNQVRMSTGKSRPLGGGRTPSLVAKWESFEDDVCAWWTRMTSSQWTQVCASQTYCKVLPLHGVISKEDGVRAALQMCVFEPVNEVLSRGLGFPFLLNETESIACVKSNADWGGFVINRDQADIFVRVALPIEVKPPWQFKLSAGDGHLIDLLQSPNPAERDKVRFSLAQIYLYMILEEAEFGVLCSKEQYVFLRRLGKPEDKALQISRVVECDDQLGVRRCLLFMCCHAQNSAAVDVGGPTPLAMKLVTPPGQRRDKKRRRTASVRSGKKQKCSKSSACFLYTGDVHGRTDSTPSKVVVHTNVEMPDVMESHIISAQACLEPSSWRRESDHKLDLISWFGKLAEFDIFSLKLGQVLSSAGKVIVREGTVQGIPTAIKLFDFADGHELLQDFRNEVQAYELLESLQGQAVPRIFAYGSLWGLYMGFLALSLEGRAVSKSDFQSQPHLVKEAKKSLKQIHAANVLHGDIAFRNLVFSAMGQTIMFVDFGRCLIGAYEESCLDELEELEELLHESQCEEPGSA